MSRTMPTPQQIEKATTLRNNLTRTLNEGSGGLTHDLAISTVPQLLSHLIAIQSDERRVAWTKSVQACMEEQVEIALKYHAEALKYEAEHVSNGRLQ